MFSLVLLAAVAQAEPAAPAAPGGVPPTQMLATIDKAGQLRLVSVTPADCDVPGLEQPFPGAGPGGPAKPERPVAKVTTVTVTTVELAAKHVAAHGTDGRPVAADKLADLLAKERPVLVARDGKKVDPFLLQLYKDDTLVLVLPPNTLPPAGAGSVGVYGVPPGVMPFPAPGPGAFPVPPVPPPAPIPEPRRKP